MESVARGRNRMPVTVRFWNMVAPANEAGCLLWKGPPTASGYGEPRKPQDAPEPPTLPDPVPGRLEAPGLPCGHRDRSLCGPECVGRLRVKLPDP